MKLQYSTFIMPHIGDCYSQCADRFAIGKNSHCFAIADGVGASFFPEVWAELVCKDFIDHCDLFEENTILLREKNLIYSWNDIVEKKISNLTDKEKFLVEMSKERCDFAACTFVGLSIDNIKWHCKALGDSYLFVLDKEYNLINSVASQKGHDFDNFPEYFASVHGKNNGTIVSVSGDISEVAYFLLLTDAISDWFVRANEDKRNALINVQDMQSFHSLIDTERASGEMKDDDTTAVILRVIQDDTENISVEELCNTDINQLIKEETIIAKQKEERLKKEAEGKVTQEQSRQIEVITPNDAPHTIVKTPSVKVAADNEEVHSLKNDKESLLAEKEKYTQVMQAIEDVMSFLRDMTKNIIKKKKKNKTIDFLAKLQKNIKKEIENVNNKLDKMQH